MSDKDSAVVIGRLTDHGIMYQVQSTKYEVWNLSQVRQGLGCRYWTVDR